MRPIPFIVRTVGTTFHCKNSINCLFTSIPRVSGLRLGQLFQQFLACLLHFNTATSCTVPFKPNCRLKMLGAAPFCQCYVTFPNYLQVWLLLAAGCNGWIEVDRLPNANQVLAELPQQQPRNSNESFKGVDYETRKYFGMN